MTLKWIYIYDPRKHCCVRRTNITRKTICEYPPFHVLFLQNHLYLTLFHSAACSRKVVNHRSRCDIHTWKRTLTRAFYRLRNCSCRKEIATTTISCRCNRRTSVTVCHKNTGIEETVFKVERFDVKADRCIKMVNVVRRPTREYILDTKDILDIK